MNEEIIDEIENKKKVKTAAVEEEKLLPEGNHAGARLSH